MVVAFIITSAISAYHH